MFQQHTAIKISETLLKLFPLIPSFFLLQLSLSQLETFS